MHQALARLADSYWDLAMANSPMWASLLGDHRFDAEVEDLSREHEDDMVERFGAIATAARAVDPTTLDRDDRITRHVLASEADSVVGALSSRTTEFMVDPMLGLHMDIIQGVPQLRALDDAQAAAFIEKASKVGGQFDQAIERHREGVSHGRTPPRISVEKVLAQLDSFAKLPLADDPFLQIALPASWDDLTRARWKKAMEEQVIGVVRPAFARYRDAVATDVLPVARPPEKSGVCWLPDGDEIYARAVRRYTSLDLGADEIHEIGREGIASLADEYRELGGRTLGTTDLADIFNRLRNDPALRFETGDQVHQAAESALARARQEIPGWFGRLPEAPCVVQPIPDVGAADTTIAYYFPPAADGTRPGIYFINLSEPTTRTRFEAEVLAFHESIPGHHLQMAIAQELEGVPAFRRHGNVTVYIEGWGLYTERLSDEMGLYSDDIARLGMLSFDSWRAGRLVVDTGLHSKGWSRQQAIDYFVENSPQAMNNIVNEVDRYIGYIGQALAYKMGQRELFRLRAEAQRTMGGRFDMKGFHDAVLSPGPVPLDLLGELVREWAAA